MYTHMYYTGVKKLYVKVEGKLIFLNWRVFKIWKPSVPHCHLVSEPSCSVVQGQDWQEALRSLKNFWPLLWTLCIQANYSLCPSPSWLSCPEHSYAVVKIIRASTVVETLLN